MKPRMARDLFIKIATKPKEFKNGSLLHLIFGGGRYVNEYALAEVDYILAKAYIYALNFKPSHPDRASYLAEAGKYLDEAKNLAQKNSLKQRLALIYALSAQRDMVKADTASAIKNGELALSESGAFKGNDMKCAMHPLLSKAYESNQFNENNLRDAIKHQQKYIDICRDKIKDKILEAQERLTRLEAKLAAQKR